MKRTRERKDRPKVTVWTPDPTFDGEPPPPPPQLTLFEQWGERVAMIALCTYMAARTFGVPLLFSVGTAVLVRVVTEYLPNAMIPATAFAVLAGMFFFMWWAGGDEDDHWGQAQ